jgi:hypothetical protein
MSKKKNRAYRRKHQTKPIISKEAIVTKPIQPIKRKYRKSKPITPIIEQKDVVAEPIVIEPIVIKEKVKPLSLKGIAKKYKYVILALGIIVIVSLILMVVIMNILPEHMTVISDNSYLSVQVK